MIIVISLFFLFVYYPVKAMVKIDGNEFPDDLYYHRDHMWVKVEGGGVRVGYNDWAQEAAGKLVNLNTRKVGRSVKAGKTLGTVESGKWVGPLKSPVAGEILEVLNRGRPTVRIIPARPRRVLKWDDHLATAVKGGGKSAEQTVSADRDGRW